MSSCNYKVSFSGLLTHDTNIYLTDSSPQRRISPLKVKSESTFLPYRFSRYNNVPQKYQRYRMTPLNNDVIPKIMYPEVTYRRVDVASRVCVSLETATSLQRLYTNGLFKLHLLFKTCRDLRFRRI